MKGYLFHCGKLLRRQGKRLDIQRMMASVLAMMSITWDFARMARQDGTILQALTASQRTL